MIRRTGRGVSEVAGLIAAIVLSCSAWAADQSTQAPLPPSELKKFERHAYTAPEIKDIEDAERDGDFSRARQLEDALIDRPTESFSNKWMAQWLKSLALHKRFQDRQALGDAHRDVLPDLLEAARYGNLKAIRQAEDILEEYLFGMNRDEYPPLTSGDISGIYKIGADLADPPSAIAWGSGRTVLLHAPLPVDLQPDERIFWLVLGLVSDQRASKTQRIGYVDTAIQRFGADTVSKGLAKFGIGGGLVQSKLSGVPGRDVHVAFAAEVDLRAEYSTAYGFAMPPSNMPEPDMSAREYFNDISAMNNVVGIGHLYLLISSRVSDTSTYIRTVDRNMVKANILPDDTMIVRCGPLSHVAVVYKIDIENNQIWFTDPLYEYWQPSHNACMTGYKLVDGPDNGYLTVVSLSEAMDVFQGLITRRSDEKTPPAAR